MITEAPCVCASFDVLPAMMHIKAFRLFDLRRRNAAGLRLSSGSEKKYSVRIGFLSGEIEKMGYIIVRYQYTLPDGC